MTDEGWYSFIQYKPDLASDEGANVGLLLIVPKSAFFRIRLATNNKRVRKLFGRTFNAKRLDLAKRSLERRIKMSAKGKTDPAELTYILRREANHLQFAELRPVAVDDPEKIFNDLFTRQVQTPPSRVKQTSRKIPEIQKLAAKLSARRIPIKTNDSVLVPAMNAVVHADLSYVNGKTHLIRGEVFTSENTPTKASYWASVGLLLQKLSEEDRAMTIVGKFPNDGKKSESRAMQIFEAHGVRAITTADLDDLAEEIEEQAHE